MEQFAHKYRTYSSRNIAKRKPLYLRAFTIVELLLVILVIAILAAITIVAFNGAQTRARASAASQALSQAKKKLELYKVDAGSYPATGSLASAGITNSDTTYQYTSTGTSYCITATNGTVSYYLDSTTHFTPTQGGCTDHTYEGGVQMTNLVTNGDFSNGVTGWSTARSTSTTSANTLINTGNGSHIFPYIRQVINIVVPPLTKFYISGSIRVTNAACSNLKMDLTNATNVTIGSATISNPVENQWYLASTNITAASTGYDYFHLLTGHMYPDAASAAGMTMEIKNQLVINLTAAFGAGKEPTKAQMDAIMQQFPNGWFNGTVTANTKGIL